MTARRIEDGHVDGGAQPFRVRDLLHHTLRADVRFNSGWEGLTRAQRVAEALKLEPVVPGQPVLLDEGDWQAVCDALRSPSPLTGQPAYPLSPGHAVVPLCELVFNAKKDEPPQ